MSDDDAKKDNESNNTTFLIIFFRFVITFSVCASIWHIYAMKPGGDGSLIPPSFTFSKNAKIILNGAVKEKGKLISEAGIKAN